MNKLEYIKALKKVKILVGVENTQELFLTIENAVKDNNKEKLRKVISSIVSPIDKELLFDYYSKKIIDTNSIKYKMFLEREKEYKENKNKLKKLEAKLDLKGWDSITDEEEFEYESLCDDIREYKRYI